MNTSVLILLKPNRLGRLCKSGAWSMLGLGIIYVMIYAFYAWNNYNEVRNSTNIINPPNFNYLYLLPSIATICLGALLTIFGFTVLYVAGAIFTSLATSLAPTQDETEDIVYESIEEPIKAQKR